jgi:hypothetical protein
MTFKIVFEGIHKSMSTVKYATMQCSIKKNPTAVFGVGWG